MYSLGFTQKIKDPREKSQGSKSSQAKNGDIWIIVRHSCFSVKDFLSRSITSSGFAIKDFSSSSHNLPLTAGQSLYPTNLANSGYCSGTAALSGISISMALPPSFFNCPEKSRERELKGFGCP